MFNRIKIRNLRAITELEIENLGQVNLFVGQNNCGKTTLLEALFFLIGATNPKLPINANIFRGLGFLRNEWWETFFHNFDSTSNIIVSGTVSNSKEEQKLVIRPVIEKQIFAESVSPDMVSINVNGGDSKPAFRHEGLELLFTSSHDPTIKTQSRIILKEDQLLTEGTRESSIRGVFVGPSTKFDWTPRFSSIQRKKKINELILSLKEIDPSIIDIRLNDVRILEVDVGLSGLIPVNLLGGGVLNFLSVALAMLDSKDGIVLIDEIENGLHYSTLHKLWQLIFSWSQDLNVQVFITSHSNECVKAFNNSVDKTLFGSEAKMFRIERKDEIFRAVEYSKENLSESIESNWEVR
ncbi:MAG: AAA family ATPase [Sedimentisphaerales bacterium]|nr:AAA family ATPase [Sedimentisphaerales bacterium]